MLVGYCCRRTRISHDSVNHSAVSMAHLKIVSLRFQSVTSIHGLPSLSHTINSGHRIHVSLVEHTCAIHTRNVTVVIGVRVRQFYGWREFCSTLRHRILYVLACCFLTHSCLHFARTIETTRFNSVFSLRVQSHPQEPAEHRNESLVTTKRCDTARWSVHLLELGQCCFDYCYSNCISTPSWLARRQVRPRMFVLELSPRKSYIGRRIQLCQGEGSMSK